MLLEADTCEDLDSLRLGLMGVNRFKSIIDLAHAFSLFRDLFLCHLIVRHLSEGVDLLEESLAFDVTVEDVLEDGHIVAHHLLLHLQDVHVSGELLDLATTDRVNKAGLTDTIAADKTVLFALDELHGSTVEQSFAANNDRHTRHHNVLLESFAFVVNNFGLRNSVFMGRKLGNFLVQGILSFCHRLCCLTSQATGIKGRVLLGLGLVDSSERVEEVIVLNSVTFLLHLVQNHGVRQLFSDDSVSLFDDDEFTLKQDFGDDLTDLVRGILRVHHAVGHEITHEGK